MSQYVKTLPVTGGLGLTVATQFRLLGIIFIVTTLIATAIHYFWRKNQTIGQ